MPLAKAFFRLNPIRRNQPMINDEVVPKCWQHWQSNATDTCLDIHYHCVSVEVIPYALDSLISWKGLMLCVIFRASTGRWDTKQGELLKPSKIDASGLRGMCQITHLFRMNTLAEFASVLAVWRMEVWMERCTDIGLDVRGLVLCTHLFHMGPPPAPTPTVGILSTSV